MSSHIRRALIVYLSDFFIVLLVLFVSRWIVPLPKWYYLVGTAVIWVVMGIVTFKLRFDEYKRIRFVLSAIFLIDVLSSAAVLFIFYRIFPYSSAHWTHIVIPVIIFLGEVSLYFMFRRLVLEKMPYLYEPVLADAKAEQGWQETLKGEQETFPSDLEKLLEGIRNLKVDKACEWVVTNKTIFSKNTFILDNTNPKDLYYYADKSPQIFIFINSFGTIWHLNTFLANANLILPVGGYIAGHCLTSGLKREMIAQCNPPIISHIFISADFIWHRFFAKLPFTKRLYFFFTKGTKREFSRVELLGRICMAGFEIIDDDIRQGEFYVSARKVGPPVAANPNVGILIRLKRVGKGGKLIGVYKFRTMHAYSEYLQGYIYSHSGLQDGGKMNHDYRITSIGHFLRKTWLDELPMLLNWIKGDMKLIGVRPLSEHYFSLYTPEMRQLRTRTKPGLIPPFYAEKVIPVTLEDVQANERRYLESYFKRPFATDWRYFWGAMRNILLKGAKSK